MFDRAIKLCGIAVILTLGAIMAVSISTREHKKQAMAGWYAKAVKNPSEDAMNLHAMVFNYNGPLANLPLEQPPEISGKVAVILSLAGCGFNHDSGNGLPRAAVVLTASKRLRSGEWAEIDACARRDGNALSQIYREQLAALLAAVKSRPWFDADRIIIRAYGEAVPIATSFDGKVVARITIGEPCIVPWENVVLTSRLKMLLMYPAAGLIDDARTHPSFSCKALPRPSRLQITRPTIISGRITTATRPTALVEAQVKAQREAIESRR